MRKREEKSSAAWFSGSRTPKEKNRRREGNTTEKIKEKIPDVSIETTPLPFQDARNYQVSSDKLKRETGFEASIELTQGIEEMYNLISSNRIKDINDPRYSNQNYLQTYGVK